MDYVRDDALVSTEWLGRHLGEPGLKVIDGSWYLPTEKRDPKAEYAAGHLPGAVYFDIDAISDTSNPLPHMFPSPATFEKAVGGLGISNADKLVVYDGGSTSAAGRVWWMFRAFGHDDIAILNGGARKWRAEGRPWTAEAPGVSPASFRAGYRPALVRAIADVFGAIDKGDEQILDARAAGRFVGTAPEPRAGMRGGHMPGAFNLPYTDLLASDGTMRPAAELKALFEQAGIDLGRPVITSCGSGVSATVLLLGLHLLGHEGGTLYDGSWSEWGSRQDTPVVTEAMRIRAYAAADEAAVIALWRAAGLLVNPLNDPARDIRFCLESGHGEILVGEEDGTVLGSVMLGHDGHRGWIYYLATAPERQGRGIGRAIMAAAEARLAEQGVPKVELIVRGSNTRVIGFYQRLGYNVEPNALLAKRLDGIAVAHGGSSTDAPVVITYLEMTARPRLPQIVPAARPLALLRCQSPTVSFYRYLYDAVGRAWIWTDRKKLSDEQLSAILGDEAVDVFVLHVGGVPAGFFELDRRSMPDIDLAYFGIMPEFIGGRLGPWLLGQAIEEAWRHEPARFIVNTCTLDHPKALPMYQRAGFQPYRRAEVPAPWQRGDDAAYE